MEKSFTQYLTESTKTYSFTIKIAGELEDNLEEKIKESLQKFAVVAMSKSKRTPIQSTLLDFPNLENSRVTSWDVSVKYPTTTQILENYISTYVNCPLQNIKICNLNEPFDLYQSAEIQHDILTTEKLESPCSIEMSNLVGQNRATGLLKDIINAKRTTGEQYKGVNDEILASNSPAEKIADNKFEPTTSDSVIGSRTFNEPFKGK